MLEDVILEQLGYFVLLAVFPFGVHTKVYLQKHVLFLLCT